MILRKLTIEAKQLKSIPEDERALFLLIQVLISELLILQKLLILCRPAADDVVLLKAQNAQRTFFIRLLAGKLCEGWELLQKLFFGSKLSQVYEPLLSAHGKNSLESLKTYFGQSNPIHKIRKTVAFHYAESAADIAKKADDLRDEEPLALYVAQEAGNCLYDMAHALLGVWMFENVGSSDWKSGVTAVWDDVIRVADWFIKMGQGVVEVFAVRHGMTEFEEVHLPDPVGFSDLSLPYFVARPKKDE